MVSAARKAIEGTYTGRCTIVEYRQVRDEKTKISRGAEITVLEDQPCRLSYEKITTAGSGQAAAISQQTKLFIAPEIEVKAGSKIVVEQEQDGRQHEFSASGEPAVYATHQEIVLELFRGWA